MAHLHVNYYAVVKNTVKYFRQYMSTPKEVKWSAPNSTHLENPTKFYGQNQNGKMR